ncbi:MAG: hypothetical protein HY084_09345 [Gemmatimonadetes bacterium]|nr:hypothetical protein [Gemmatimonadota bacterium]
MNIVMQLHRAAVTDAQRAKYERMVKARARKLSGAVQATVRLSEDGDQRRAEIVLDVARLPSIVVAAEGRWFATCVGLALDRLDARILKAKQTPKTRARRSRAAASRR